MPTQREIKIRRLEIPYFEGINALVGSNLSKKQDLRHAENIRSTTIGYLEKRKGYTRLGDDISPVANYNIFFFENSNANSIGMFRLTDVGGTRTVYYLHTDGTWTALTGGGTNLAASDADDAVAKDCCFIVNGSDANRYIDSDGTTVVTSSSATGHLYNSPIANFVNYYKGRLYLGDYTVGSTRYKNGIMRSSRPLGIVSLVDSDHSSPITSLQITDTVYIHSSDTLQIYRGGTLITGTTDLDATSQFDVTNPSGDTMRYTYDSTGTDPDIDTYIAEDTEVTISGFNASNNGTFQVTSVGANYFEVTNASGVVESNITGVSITINTITVTAKTEDTLTINSFKNSMDSADEVWVYNSYTGDRKFRWADNPVSGLDVKQYDTFTLSGGLDDELTMLTNVGNVQMIANKQNMGTWDDYELVNFELGIGCVSKRGYVKASGVLFFVDYTGIYATSGSTPKLMSAKIERYINGATKSGLESAAAGKQRFSVFFYIGNVTLYNDDGSTEKTLSDVVLEYNMRQENWYVHTGIPADQFEQYYHTTDPNRLVFSNGDSNQVSELFHGLVDDGKGNQDEIPALIESNEFVLSEEFENISYPHEFIIEVKSGSAAKIFVSLDNQQMYELPQDIRKGVNVVKVVSKKNNEGLVRCRTIKLIIKEFSASPFSVSRAALHYTDAPEEESHHN